MKRVLPLILVVALVVAMAVPAMAAEPVEGYAYTFNETVNITYQWASTSKGDDFYSNGVIYDAMSFDYYDNTIKYFTRNDSVIVYDDGWVNDIYRDIYFIVDPSLFHNDLKTWFGNNGVFKCTGVSCPATDENYDNVCDDCGNTFAILRSYPNPDGWPSSIPAPPAQYETMILLTENDSTWLYMVDEAVSATITDPNADGKRTLSFAFSADNTVQRYRLLDGGWAYSSVNSLRSFSFDETLDFEFSTVDILDARGQPFFPLPLWVEMEQVTQGEMTGLVQTMGGTMNILTLCGVGLMALLVVLSLFGRRSLIFRS